MNNNHPLLIPGAIVLAGLLIAGAVLVATYDEPNPPAKDTETTKAIDAVRPVDATDFVKGDRNAPVKIISYSDFECPFCKQFHTTMNQVMETYGKQGEVAWVFRHFPIEQLHSKAPTIALASECVAEQGGNDAFWQFADRYFDVSLTNNRTDIETVIPNLVKEIGLDQSAFEACMNSRALMAQVEADYNNAVETGGRGTPWSIVIGPHGTTFPLSGAQPLAAIERIIAIARNDN